VFHSTRTSYGYVLFTNELTCSIDRRLYFFYDLLDDVFKHWYLVRCTDNFLDFRPIDIGSRDPIDEIIVCPESFADHLRIVRDPSR